MSAKYRVDFTPELWKRTAVALLRYIDLCEKQLQSGFSDKEYWVTRQIGAKEAYSLMGQFKIVEADDATV